MIPFDFMPMAAALNYHSIFFYIFALVACGFAAAVLASKNVVRMAFYLTLALGSISGLFFLAGSEFVGAMQFMIYVGGTLVLLIFGVMLTAQSRFISMETPAGEWVLGAVVGGALLLLLFRVAFSVDAWTTPLSTDERAALVMADSKTSTPIGLALSGIRVDKLDGPSEGKSGYLLPFVIVSMHLLVVLIGAGYMARTKKSRTGASLDRPAAPAIPKDRKRYFPVVGGLASGAVANLVLAIAAFSLVFAPSLLKPSGEAASKASELAQMIGSKLAEVPSWAAVLLGLLFFANVLLFSVVYNWQKWGVVGLVVIPCIQAFAISSTPLGAAVAGVFLVLALAPVALLIALMVGFGKPTMWSQFE